MALPRRLTSELGAPNTEGEDGSSAWLDAHYDPVASLYTFSSCMALEDLNRDGDHKLLVGDLGNGQVDMKLKLYKGTELTFETPLVQLPTAVCSFYVDSTEPRTPAVAVASGSFIYMYKNLRPYFKFTLPFLELNSTESDLWDQVKEDKMEPLVMREVLESMNSEGTDVPLSVRSLKFLLLDQEDLIPFVSLFKHVPLRRHSVITCMSTLKKSHVDDDAISCIVVGTENKDIYVLDPVAFTILAKLTIPAVPVFLCPTGLFDVDYQISVAARDACIYTFKSGGRTPKYRFAVGSQPCGLQRVDRDIVVGCMDQTLSCFTVKGKRLWVHKLPDAITLLEMMDFKTQGVKGIIVALRNKEVRIYRGKSLVNMLQVDDVVVGLKFGQFGREDGAMLMVTQGGALIIKILKRSASLEIKDMHSGPPKAQGIKLNLPKKTKIIVDQTVRERKDFAVMHEVFQRDLLRLKLETTRSYSKAITESLAPVITAQNTSLKVTAQVQGLGPVFKLTVGIQNSTPSSLPNDLFITFKCNETLYRIKNKFIKVPMLIPELNYNFETTVESLDDMGRAEDISVFVLKTGNPIPLISAVIKMPLSENVIIV